MGVSPATSISINRDRFLADLHALRAFGAVRAGVVRTAYSEADMASRRWLEGKFVSAGLEATIDGVGNVIARSRNPGPAVLIGSHSDTQPEGGWLDGAYGVICGLEVARALAEDRSTQSLAVDVAAWQDEEGTYLDCLGSGSFVGAMALADIASAANSSGETVRQALVRLGLWGRPLARAEKGRQLAYLEAHIEQGPVLEQRAKRIGVVTSIFGIRNYRVKLRGQQNHAGTTPMTLRRDAGMGAIHLSYALVDALRTVAGPDTVYTIGAMHFEPGASSIIPGHAEFLVQVRDAQEAALDRMNDAIEAVVDRFSKSSPLLVELARSQSSHLATPMDEQLQSELCNASEARARGQWMALPSGAGHDAQIISKVIPSAMLFVPSVGGVSHSFEEDTSEDDLVLGCEVLAQAAASILLSKRK